MPGSPHYLPPDSHSPSSSAIPQPHPLPQTWTQLTYGPWGPWGPSWSLGPVAAGLSEGVGQKWVPWGRKEGDWAGQG